ncbi:unnamed protein product [Adineta ricciae]|uniref:Uncharacterized protein n=1 Tax=Adineta ricciae TaxID=249248 RepID=A0A814EJY9_ADIRI|nr:unnamed protein product [Adineta ricciae]
MYLRRQVYNGNQVDPTTETSKPATDTIVPNQAQSQLSRTHTKLKATEKLNKFIQPSCYRQFTSNQKLAPNLILASIAVFPPVVLLVINRTTPRKKVIRAKSSIVFSKLFSSHTTSINPCSSATCIGQETSNLITTVVILYSFDGNANDSNGRFNGVSYGAPTYVAQSYVGTSALNLNSTSSQYI